MNLQLAITNKIDYVIAMITGHLFMLCCIYGAICNSKRPLISEEYKQCQVIYMLVFIHSLDHQNVFSKHSENWKTNETVIRESRKLWRNPSPTLTRIYVFWKVKSCSPVVQEPHCREKVLCSLPHSQVRL